MNELSSLLSYRIRPQVRAWVPVQIFGMTLSFFLISSAAIYYSLGYHINWQAHSLQQTGIAVLDSRYINPNTATVLFNGKQLSGSFPFREAHLFPGTYTLSITRPGYQPWQHDIRINPNLVITIPNIIQIKNEDTIVPQQVTFFTFSDPDQRGIEIRENELWVRGKFITRSSDDILAAQWFPDNSHVVYQSGKELRIYDLESQVSQTLLHTKLLLPLRFSFSQNGRILLFTESGKYYQAELYD
jgi:hypothetical protein